MGEDAWEYLVPEEHPRHEELQAAHRGAQTELNGTTTSGWDLRNAYDPRLASAGRKVSTPLPPGLPRQLPKKPPGAPGAAFLGFFKMRTFSMKFTST